MKHTIATVIALLLTPLAIHAGNPIVEGIGLTDPHAVVYGDRVWVYATHDADAKATKFVTKDWWVWSSADLVNWKHEGTLRPQETFIGQPSNACWAGFGISHNNKYYWYFSAGPTEIRSRSGIATRHCVFT
jgi:sucrose-6-phosphate hydrolase SacC (GH32 family)